MKKMAPVVIPVFVFLVGLFIGYRLFSTQKTPENSKQVSENFNPFLVKSKTGNSDSKIPDLYNLPGNILTVHNHNFTQAQLPLEVRLNIYREQVAYFERVRAVLTEFGLRINAVVDSQIPISSYDKIPQLPEVYSYLVTPEEIQEIYNKNLDKFPKDMSKDEILLSINTQLLTERLVRKFKEDSIQLEKSKKLKVYENAPKIPDGAVPYDRYFQLGNREGDIQIFFTGSYFCEECFEYDKVFVEIFSKYGERVNFFYFPHFQNLMEAPGIFARAGYCLYKQSPNVFWQYHYSMTQSYADYSKRFEKSTNPDKVYEYVNSKISSLEYNKEGFNHCFSEKNADTMTELYKLSRIVEHIGLGSIPAVVLNGRKLPLTVSENLDVIIEEFL